VVLLMDVGDQLSVLEAASALSLTTKHAFFTFTKTPYDENIQSVLGLKYEDMMQPVFYNDSIVPGTSIFESLFVIGYTFPSDSLQNRTALESVRIKRDVNINTDFTSLHSNGADFTSLHSNGATGIYQRRKGKKGHTDDNSLKMHDFKVRKESHDILYRHQSGKVIVKRQAVSANVDNMSQGFQGITDDTHKMSSSENSSMVAQARLIKNNNDSATIQSSDIKTSQNIEDVFILHSNASQHVRQQNTSSDLPEKNVHPKTSDSLVFESEYQILPSKANLDMDPMLNLHPMLAAKFRSKRDIETYIPSGADSSATYDLVFLLAYAVHLLTKTTNSVPFTDQLIASMANLSFPGHSGRFEIDPGQQVSFDFQVYDFNVTAGAMKPTVYYLAASSETWVLGQQHPLRWPGGIILSPDECFKQQPGCDD
ncbi:unnamed protein product, partial [Candidula unifasciata]